MSLEKKIEALNASIINLTEALTACNMAVGETPAYAPKLDKPTKSNKNSKAGKKPSEEAPPRDLNPEPSPELQQRAKELATRVFEEVGAEALGEILQWLGAKKLSDLAKTVPVYIDVVDRCERVLGISGDKEKPAPAPASLSLEDVKAVILKVANHPNLGKDSIKAIFDAHGVEKLSLMKPEQYAGVKEDAEIALAEV